jgi:hypothetical protein
MMLFFACSQHNRNKEFVDIDFMEGDLVFRKGAGAKTRAVLYADSLGIYSHTGIVVKDDTDFKIIHITPSERKKGDSVDRIKIESPETFWRNDRAIHGAVYRLKDRTCCLEAVKQAQRLLEKGVLFDHNYQLDDTLKMYCTELIWYVYQLAGKDITSGKRSVLENVPLYSGTYIFPSDIYRNKDFELIYKF